MANEQTEIPCIIVVEATDTACRTQVGVVIDSVLEVLHINGGDIEEAPSFGTALETDYILGMAKMEGAIKTLLDVDRALTGAEPAPAASSESLFHATSQSIVNNVVRECRK